MVKTCQLSAITVCSGPLASTGGLAPAAVLTSDHSPAAAGDIPTVLAPFLCLRLLSCPTWCQLRVLEQLEVAEGCGGHAPLRARGRGEAPAAAAAVAGVQPRDALPAPLLASVVQTLTIFSEYSHRYFPQPQLTLVTASSPRLPDLRTLVKGPGEAALVMLVTGLAVLPPAPSSGHTRWQVIVTGSLLRLDCRAGDWQLPSLRCR